MEATASAASTRGPAAAPPARRSGVGVVGTVVCVRHYVVSFVDISKRFGLMTCWICSAVFVVMVIVVMSVYIFFVVVCGTVGVLHRSHVVRGEGSLVFGGVYFLRSFSMSVGVAVYFVGT